MMSFCKKSVHSFLALSNPLLNIETINSHEKTSSKSSPSPSKGVPDGLGLISSVAATQKRANVLESTTIKFVSSLSSSSSSSSLVSLPSPPTPSSPTPSLSTTSGKKDPGGIGFIDDIGGGVDGLMSCTESLGFESSDERRVNDEIELCSSDLRSMSNVKRRKYGERREVKKFPPPLSSFNYNGQPSFFLKPVRRDGRLELTEVRIDRPEILHASRENGRLILHLVRQDEEEEDNELFDIEEEKEEQETQEEIVEEKEKEKGIEEKQEKEEVEEIFEEEKLGEEKIEKWSVLSTNGENFVRRCHNDVVTLLHHHLECHHHHHHYNNHRNDHHMHMWSQQCVTTR